MGDGRSVETGVAVGVGGGGGGGSVRGQGGDGGGDFCLYRGGYVRRLRQCGPSLGRWFCRRGTSQANTASSSAITTATRIILFIQVDSFSEYDDRKQPGRQRPLGMNGPTVLASSRIVYGGHIQIYVRKRHAGSQQLLALGFRGAARQFGDSGAAGAGAAVGRRASLSLQLVRIALCLCDSHPNKLKEVTCGPVSQTRVCEPPRQGDSSTRTTS